MTNLATNNSNLATKYRVDYRYLVLVTKVLSLIGTNVTEKLEEFG